MPDLRRARFHITGIVQGVGFRPFVYGLATRLNLNGWVQNTTAGVDIEVDGTQSVLDNFIFALRSELPPLAWIDTIEVSFMTPGRFNSFEIIHSENVEGAFQPISPDVCICQDCLHELFDSSDRRYRYPFINCTNCGPRFTIITDIPYDRSNTTMAPFIMCPACAAEYQNPLDRRFHAQPVACPVCGPHIWLEGIEDGGRRKINGDKAITESQRLLGEGRILAIKGLGGFHLACDATNQDAVSELRRRKLRVDKPFALMMPDLASVEQHCFVNPDERTLLQSRQRPIVLLKRKPESTIAEEVSPKQNTLGVMLPYTPLHYILFKSKEQFLTAFVMTSGNISEEPIATDNKEAHERLGDLADAFLMHNREIQTRCDDSVLRVTNLKEQETDASQHSLRVNQYMLRRSRGYAPNPVLLPFEVAPILAVGSELKNTFCLTRDRYAFLSHHIGDMENYETLRSFDEGITHFERLFRIQPEAFVHDLHPDYLSTRYALQRAQRENLPTVAVQHHHAHIAACMADNGLDGSMRVIGLSFDGTGYGVDGAIWGGEIFLADYAGFERKFHLAYFPLPGGNSAIMRPARTALALLWSLGLDWDESLASVKDLCFEERQALRVQLERGLNAPQTSSLGRLFDAVAALADVRQQVNYEAQAAMEFESALDETESGMYRFDMQRNTIDLKPVISALLADVFAGVHIPIISARFHNGLTDLARAVCDTLHQETGIREVVLSGGVWQNMALLKRVVRVLRADGFKIYFHQNIPTNDGGLALGQVLAGASQLDL